MFCSLYLLIVRLQQVPFTIPQTKQDFEAIFEGAAWHLEFRDECCKGTEVKEVLLRHFDYRETGYDCRFYGLDVVVGRIDDSLVSYFTLDVAKDTIKGHVAVPWD